MLTLIGPSDTWLASGHRRLSSSAITHRLFDAAIAYALAYRERGEFLSSFLTTDDLHDDASTAALTNLGFTCTSLPPDAALGRT